MAYEIPVIDGKQVTKLQPDEPWGHAIKDPVTGKPATYGKHAIPEDKQKHLLKVSENPPHRIYYREYGNPKGEPIIVVHGGPGGGCSIDDAKFIDPKRYRIILFDQRGNGNSEPTVANNPEEAMNGNNTANLVADMVKLRDKLNIKGKMHLFGGSWGSTLSLLYAIEHPDHVKSLQLRGIFLGRRNVFDFFYQGNAVEYVEASEELRKPLDALNSLRNAHNAAKDAVKEAKITHDAGKITEAEQNLLAHPPLTEQQEADLLKAQTDLFATLKDQPQTAWGAYRAHLGDPKHPDIEQLPESVRTPTMARAYAELWDDFVRIIPKEKRGDMVAAYSEIFETKPETPQQCDYQIRAAKAWARWEGLTSYLIQDPSDLGKFDDNDFAVNFARIENRYFMHGCYMGMKEGQNPHDFNGQRNNNWIMENLDKLKGIHISFTHPPTDQVTLQSDADELFNGLVKVNDLAELPATSYLRSAVTKTGHNLLNYFMPICGHSRTERPNKDALVEINRIAPRITRAEMARTSGPRDMETHAETGKGAAELPSH